MESEGETIICGRIAWQMVGHRVLGYIESSHIVRSFDNAKYDAEMIPAQRIIYPGGWVILHSENQIKKEGLYGKRF